MNKGNIEIDYKELKYEIGALLGDNKIMVLATSSEYRVTARSMSCVIMNEKIYFQTDKTFLKHEQMVKNPNVALCVNNIQIEGIAKIKGHPFEDENREFIRLFEEKHRGSYDCYSHMKNEVVVEVEPVLITLWKYEGTQPIREFLHTKERKAYREVYNTNE